VAEHAPLTRHRVDEEQAAALHRLMLGMGFDAFRIPGVFGPALDVEKSAPAHRQLLGFLGRVAGANQQGAPLRVAGA